MRTYELGSARFAQPGGMCEHVKLTIFIIFCKMGEKKKSVFVV